MIDKNSYNKTPFDPAKWPFFYGWMILFWGMVGILFSAPGQTTGVAAFIEPLLKSLGVSRFQLSTAYMVGTLTSGVMLTFVGKIYDRLGARWMGSGACLMLGVVMLLFSQVDHVGRLIPGSAGLLVVLALLFFLLRLSGQGILTMVSRNMVMKWFNRRRGLAAGLSGAAVAICFPYTPTLVGHWIEKEGWSTTWWCMGLMWSVGALLLFLFFRDNPEDCGLRSDGDGTLAEGVRKGDDEVFATLGAAVGSRTFWIFALTLALHALLITAITFHMESIFTLAGLQGADGFMMLLRAGMVTLIVNLLGGWLSDRISLRPLFGLMQLAIVGIVTGLVMLDTRGFIYLVTVSIGVATGLFGVLMSIAWPKLYGRRHLGAISGLSMTLMVLGSAFGPMIFSAVERSTGNYQLGLGLCLGVVTLLAGGLVFCKRSERE